MPEVVAPIHELVKKQTMIGSQPRESHPIRNHELLDEEIEIFLCVKHGSKITKSKAKIVIGPHPIKKPRFIEVKKDGIQIQINLSRFGVIPSNSGKYPENRWIELIPF